MVPELAVALENPFGIRRLALKVTQLGREASPGPVHPHSGSTAGEAHDQGRLRRSESIPHRERDELLIHGRKGRQGPADPDCHLVSALAGSHRARTLHQIVGEPTKVARRPHRGQRGRGSVVSKAHAPSDAEDPRQPCVTYGQRVLSTPHDQEGLAQQVLGIRVGYPASEEGQDSRSRLTIELLELPLRERHLVPPARAVAAIR